MAPIKTLPVTAERAHKVSLVLVRTGCTRAIAASYLDAAYGDVLEACESWRIDHRRFDMPAFAHRSPASLEASD